MSLSPLQNRYAPLHMSGQGEGDTIVLLHGWGMHSGIWHGLADALARRFHVICIDLPGHGASPADCPFELDQVGDLLLSQLRQPCHWLGWSLGGSVVMNLAARAPEHVKSMSLVAASPHFVSEPGWSCGVPADLLEQFGRELQQDYRKTLKRFIALQTLHSRSSAAALKQLRNKLFDHGEPDKDSLLQGLDVLLHADLRPALYQNRRPCLVMLGERDQLVPASVAAYYRALPCAPELLTIGGAGHAPFLSDQHAVVTAVTEFILDQDRTDDRQ